MGKQEKKNYSAAARELLKAREPVSSQRPKNEAPSHPGGTRQFIEAVIFALIAAFFLKTFIFEAYRIPSGSMEKTLDVGDFLLVNKFIYGAKTPFTIPLTEISIPHITLPAMREPKRGDVVVFIYPGDRDQLRSAEITNYIKRCVGTPGDVVEVRNKTLYVNGEKFFTPPNMQYLRPFPIPKDSAFGEMFPRGAHWNPDNYGPIRVPKKGDVIQLNDTNFFAWSVFIERAGHDAALRDNGIYIDGKPATSYTVQRNYYFMMGDNRDDSEDSRFWGFVPDDNIVGQAMIIYWSWDPDIPFGDLMKKFGSTRWSRIAQLVH